MFKQRTLTAFFLILVVGLMVWLGGWFFTIFIFAALLLCGYEWVTMFRAQKFQPSMVLIFLGIGGILLLRTLVMVSVLEIFLLLFLLFTLSFGIYQYEKGIDTAPLNFLICLSGVIYLGGLGWYFIGIRNMPNGHLWLLFFTAIAAIGDTGAYLIGQRWGRHKMGKRVSPNKSWEGYFGGIFFALITGAVFFLVSGEWFPLSLPEAMLFSGLVYCILPVGDFGISLFKRWAGVKNTGELLPGHGGILDRIDTHLWMAAIGFFYLQFVVFPA